MTLNNEYNKIRLNLIINHFSKEWFEFKTILLIGFKDDYVVNRLVELKANIINTDYKNVKFDLIININSLSNNNWQNELQHYLSKCNNLVLETELIDFGNNSEEDVVYTEYNENDVILSTESIEHIFKDDDFNFKRYKDKLLNNINKTNRFWISTKNN
jgi:hypothetical protein